MSILEDFEAAAVEIFNTFDSLLVNATYVRETSDYIAGGNTVLTTTEYPIRLVRDEGRSTLTLQSVGSVAEDVTFNSLKYLMITKELSVTAQVKDKVKVGDSCKVILHIDVDPGEVITTLYVG